MNKGNEVILMAVNYNGLIDVLKKKGLSLTQVSGDLNISSATRAKFKKGEYVSLQTIESLCKYLGVKVNDILMIEIEKKDSALLVQLKEEMLHGIKGSIYHETQILMTYNSNHIEGSRLTADQTRYIFETNTIGTENDESINVDDVIETQNHFRCIDYAIKMAFEPLTETLVKDIHKILKTGTSDSKLEWFNVGDYKQRPNTVGGLETSQPKDVSKDVAKLIGLYENKLQYKFEDILEFHYNFEIIHPFQDGNGRVGRIIAFKECLRHGIVPFTIDESIKMFYYRGFKEWKNESGYLIGTCETGQDKYKKLLDIYGIEY
jgi:Fic family protein